MENSPAQRAPPHLCYKCGQAQDKNGELATTSNTIFNPAPDSNVRQPNKFRFENCKFCRKPEHARHTCRFSPKLAQKVQNIQRQVLNTGYVITVTVNEVLCKGYLDTGNEINVSTKTFISRLKVNLESTDAYITGFGNHIVCPLGKALATISFKEFSISAYIYFVEANLGEVDIIVGQPIINHTNIEIKLMGGVVSLSKLDHPTSTRTNQTKKVNIIVGKDVSIPPHESAAVEIVSDGTGGIIVPARVLAISQFPTVISNLKQFTIKVTNTRPRDLKLSKHTLLTRAYNFSQGILSYSQRPQSRIQDNDVGHVVCDHIQIGNQPRLRKLLTQYADCFANNTGELGKTNLIQFEINLESLQPSPTGFPKRKNNPERKDQRSAQK